MKKLIFILGCLIIPISVNADSVSLNCASQIDAGSEFDCEIIGNTTHKIFTVDAIVSTTSGISFVSFIPGDDWQGDGEDGVIALFSADDYTGEFKIGTLRFKSIADSNNIVTIDQIFFSEEKKEISVDSITKEFTIIKNEDPPNNIGSASKEEETNNDNSNNSDNNDNDTNDNITINDNINDNSEEFLNDKEEDNDKINYSIIFIVIIGLLVIVNIIRLLFRNKKKISGESNE